MARNIFISGTDGFSSVGGGLMFMVGMIVMSFAVISIIVLGCADCFDNGGGGGGGHFSSSAGAAAAGGATYGGDGGGGGGAGAC